MLSVVHESFSRYFQLPHVNLPPGDSTWLFYPPVGGHLTLESLNLTIPFSTQSSSAELPVKVNLGGGLRYILSSSLFGEDEPIVTSIFCEKVGWFNHQLGICCTKIHVLPSRISQACLVSWPNYPSTPPKWAWNCSIPRYHQAGVGGCLLVNLHQVVSKQK